MSNLHKHAKICWGKEAVAAANNTRDVQSAWEALEQLKLVDGSIGFSSINVFNVPI